MYDSGMLLEGPRETQNSSIQIAGGPQAEILTNQLPEART
jgi:hypothetical protein